MGPRTLPRAQTCALEFARARNFGHHSLAAAVSGGSISEWPLRTAAATTSIVKIVALSILVSIATSRYSFAADIQPGNCARAASYSENKRGFSILAMQNGKTIFEHYANG